MKELVIDLSADGKAEALHTDEFPLDFLGKMRMQRASHIEFNEEDQAWDVWVYHEDKRTTINGFPSYERAREFEVEWLQACRKIEVHPTSEAGESIAKELAPFHQIL